MKSHFLAFAFLALFSRPIFAQNTFPWLQPFDDAAKTLTDASDLNPAPLVDNSRIEIKNGHFFDANGRRVRFLGTNLVANSALATPEIAEKAAARLHKLGFNCVRLHHLDASWAKPGIFGRDENYNAWQGPTQKVDAQSLNRLDFFVAQLKKNGVYTNLNLHVARRLTPGDGFQNSENLPEMGKILAYFEPRFIQLQKDYARQILSHVNPYTGQKWSDDAAIALVEINNEDSLVGAAFSGELNALPDEYRKPLEVRWNEFLGARYGSTAKLKTAWSGEIPVGENLLQNPIFSDEMAHWTLEDQENTGATLALEDLAPAEGIAGRALRISIPKKPEIDWKIQLHQTGLTLRDGQSYTVSFWAKSAAPRAISQNAGLDQAPWSAIGPFRNLDLTPQWRRFSAILTPRGAIEGHNRLSFGLGQSAGAVWLADVQIQPGIALDLGQNSLETKNLPIPAPGASVPIQARDWVAFLMEIEREYSVSMRDFLKNELGYKGLVTCSQSSYGALAGALRESRMDWVDMHAYWQHPRFPRRSWDMNDWEISNSAMSADAGGGTFGALAMHRVAGKPFTVSEYNHPFPNQFAAESVPMILAYAAWQDWDGVFLYSHLGNENSWKSDKIEGFFDAHNDPAKVAFLPSMARLFLSGALAPVEAKKTILRVGRDNVAAQTAPVLASGQGWRGAVDVWREAGAKPRDFLAGRMEIEFAEGDAPPKLERNLAPTMENALSWTQNGARNVFSVDAPTARVLVGQWTNDWAQAGDFLAQSGPTTRDFAALTLVSLDGKAIAHSKSLLLTALVGAQNTGMKWNEAQTMVSNWGSAPIVVETPKLSVAFPTNLQKPGVWALSATGERLKSVPATVENGILRFETSFEDGAVFYEIGGE